MLFILFVLFYGCEGDDNRTTITGPSGGECSAPSSLNANVRENGCSATRCTAAFSVSGAMLRRTDWTFVAGTPSQSAARTGTTTWPRRIFPFVESWSLVACNSTAANDPSNRCCAESQDIVTFTSTSG